jgi:molecular chaperone GrpE
VTIMPDEQKKTETPEVSTAGDHHKITELEKKLSEYLDGWKRAKADYLNLKRETDKKVQETIQFANAALIIELLPINDHFKLAIAHIPKEELGKEWIKGLFAINKELKDMLSRFGIEEIETVGKEFNPELHEAVTKEKAEGVKPHHIIKELQPGYKLFGKVLQHAKVSVAE